MFNALNAQRFFLLLSRKRDISGFFLKIDVPLKSGSGDFFWELKMLRMFTMKTKCFVKLEGE